MPEFRPHPEGFPGCDECEGDCLCILRFDELWIDDIVEVYWEGERKWFKGKITNVDLVDIQYEVHYDLDNTKFWHNYNEYPSIRYGTYYYSDDE